MKLKVLHHSEWVDRMIHNGE